MIEQVESLKSRYEACETRRKREGEGYQADINILRQKLKHVEQQLIRANIAHVDTLPPVPMSFPQPEHLGDIVRA